MNKGDSAGGGHRLSPASPAVTDRRSTQQIANTSILNTSELNSKTSTTTSSTATTPTKFQEIISQQLHQKQHQQQTSSGSAVSSSTNSTIVSTSHSPSHTAQNLPSSNLTLQPQSTRNILVVTSTIPQSMTITQQSKDGISSPIVSVVNRPSSYISTTAASTTSIVVPSSTVTASVVNNPTHSQVKRYSENVEELYFLSIGGNMMDYPTWKKKPLPQQFNNFNKAYRLNALTKNEDQKQASSIQSSNLNNLPEGAEVKISGIGVTPVAVSKTLPASVVQLTQQGHIPGRPIGGRHGMVFGQIPVSPAIGNSSVPLVPDKSAAIPPITQSPNVANSPLSKSSSALEVFNNNGNGGSSDVTVKAKQEVHVLQRISELQREGLWTEKRLPKLQEPSRPKAHWDYLLEEMVWLAADFAQERKWKKNAAKKCSRMVQKYFQDRANAAQKAEKAQELHLKRVAAFIAREVKIFWSNVEKIVEYKHTTKLEEKRKKALDQHLNFIVDQTEKFSQQLVEGMNKTVNTAENSAAASLNSSRISSPKRENASDDEFRPGEDSQDDEETIAKAEEENNSDVKDEIEALQKESEMDLDDFLNELPKDYLANREKLIQQETLSKSDDDDEEAEGNDVDHEKEIDELNAEAEMSIDELIAKYNANPPPKVSSGTSSASRRRSTRLAPIDEPSVHMDIDSDDYSEEENDKTDEEEDDDDYLTADEDNKNESGENTGLKSLLEDDPEKGDDLLHDAAALAESIQPKGNTLSSTNVVTPVPFLLKHTLREYQHIGLDWLVTMCDRKLNGILADEMGLGKTIQTIALLAHLACEKGNWGPHLIVVPSSVILNWEMEFKKWCPGFKILTYYGNQKERKLKRVGWTKPNAFHICITSYKLSQRWQLLLNFQTEQRLLLTGTPLQNNLMELWSLMHFLMPHVFQSHREFKEWFSNPVSGMIEGNAEYNESIIKRLHKVLRPFLLRRLKSEVEKQMPQKYEHVVMCRLSKRQRYLYDDFMGRAKTQETLNSGNLLNVINVLMQLRKVCNHPNLFETRPTISPFQMEGLSVKAPSIVCNIFKYDPFENIDLSALNLLLIQIETTLTAYVSYKIKRLQAPRKLIEEIDSNSTFTPKCPKGDYKFYVRVKDTKTSETMPPILILLANINPLNKTVLLDNNSLVNALAQELKSPIDVKMETEAETSLEINDNTKNMSTENDSEFNFKIYSEQRKFERTQNLMIQASINKRRCAATPIYGSDCRMSLENALSPIHKIDNSTWNSRSFTNCRRAQLSSYNWALERAIKSFEERTLGMSDIFDNFVLFVPSVLAPQPYLHARHLDPSKTSKERYREKMLRYHMSSKLSLLHPIISQMSTKFPDPRLIQYDCGKLQTLDRLLKTLKDGQHRVLIFTQMTKMLDVLEAFLNFHGHIYLRLDANFCVHSVDQKWRCWFNLTGADTVIFYDSDWNPTMDAQAQDRCHRIGQTRDVHIYRLISEKTIEENILKKANQKRMLGDLAIEGGNFTTAFFKTTTIQGLFEVQQENDASTRLAEVVESRSIQASEKVRDEKTSISTFENALAEAEDEQDVEAAKVAAAEAAADLDEFDENIPLEEIEKPEVSKVDQEMEQIVSQIGCDQKQEEELQKLEQIDNEGGDEYESDEDMMLTYSQEDASNQVKKRIKSSIPLSRSKKIINKRLTKVKEQHVRIIKNNKQSQISLKKKIVSSPKRPLRKRPNTISSSKMKASNGRDSVSNKKRKIDISNRRVTRSSPKKSSPNKSSCSNKKEPSISSNSDGDDEQNEQESEDERSFNNGRSSKNTNVTDDDETTMTECSLDVMLHDTTTNSTNCNKSDSENLSSKENPYSDYEEKEGGGPLLKNKLNNKLDVNSPRTRSRGSVKINLWTLDESPILPSRNSVHNNKKDSSSNLDDVNELISTPKIPNKTKIMLSSSIWISNNGFEEMPLWCPPTPPQNDNDLSLFDHPSAAIAKIRRDLKSQRYRGVFKPNIQVPGLKQQINQKAMVEPEGTPEWGIFEEVAVLHCLQNLQGLPLNLMLLSPGHTPNWDLVAETVNLYSKTYRPPGHCRAKFLAHIVPKEEGKLIDSPKKQKKLKLSSKPYLKGGLKMLKSSQQFSSDNNASYTRLMKNRFDAIKAAYLQKAPPPKRKFSTPSSTNLKHAEVLCSFGITSYDAPMSPTTIATRKAEKLREKHHHHHQQQQCSNNSQQISVQQSTPTAIIVQQSSSPQVTQILQRSQSTSSNSSGGTPTTSSGIQVHHHPSGQIVKAIVTPQQSPQIQLQQGNGTAQIVSLQPQQSQTSSTMVQAIPTTQVVSVSQLTTVGTVLTTSAGLQSTGSVTTLNAPGIRTQRIVTGPGSIQEVVLQQRPNTQSLQQSGKITSSQPTAQILYRQQPSRNQIKILQAQPGQGTTLVNTSGAINIVPATTQTMQVQGQKVTVASSAAGQPTQSIVTSVATVQVAQGQSRPQFIKQVGTKVGRADNEMLLVKRQPASQSQNTQVSSSGSTQVNLGQQQQQQQIATIVKTATGNSANITTSGNMLSQIKPSGQIKVMGNQTQMRSLQLQQQPLYQRKVGSAVTVQQIQQVIRHGAPGTLQTGGQIVLGKTRVIPVSLASQPNARQAIQVVSTGPSGQTINANNLRTHVASTQNISGTIKVTSSNASQQQQTQQSTQSHQSRQNSSPVRIQTGSNLVAVAVQQILPPQTSGQSIELQNVQQQQQPQQQASQSTTSTSSQQTTQQQPQK
uniref:Helicase domino n=1 Tax=Megaselia scalaris TaxID=36166 RepID=T1GWQ3_MEGSC